MLCPGFVHPCLLGVSHDDVIKWKLFSALLAFCAGNSPVYGEFPAQRPVTRSFDIFLSAPESTVKQTMEMPVFETPSRSLSRHCNELQTGRPFRG